MDSVRLDLFPCGFGFAPKPFFGPYAFKRRFARECGSRIDAKVFLIGSSRQSGGTG